jgi:hypothetical protein
MEKITAMSKKNITRSINYAKDYKQAIHLFIYCICEELDSYLEDDMIAASSNDVDYYEAICQFGDGSIYELAVEWNKANEEWDCVAIRKKVGS